MKCSSHRGSHVYGTRQAWGGQAFHPCFDTRQHPSSGKRSWVPSESLLRRCRIIGLGKLTQDLASLTKRESKNHGKVSTAQLCKQRKRPISPGSSPSCLWHTHTRTHMCVSVNVHTETPLHLQRETTMKGRHGLFLLGAVLFPLNHI